MNTRRKECITEMLRVVRGLLTEKMCIRDLADVVGVHHRTVYRIVKGLRQSGLNVQSSRDGRYMIYYLYKMDVLDWIAGPPAERKV